MGDNLASDCAFEFVDLPVPAIDILAFHGMVFLTEENLSGGDVHVVREL